MNQTFLFKWREVSHVGQILHQNSKGVKMIREDFKLRSKVRVVSEYAGKQYHLRTYRFNYIPEPIEVPYCSWANLDCCGGWNFDEEYLDTAVQKGLKLFAGRDTLLRHEYVPAAPTLEKARCQFEVFKGNLPSGVFADIDTQPDGGRKSFHTFICRTGKISDYIDLDTVFNLYKRLGQEVSFSEKSEVERLCDIQIPLFGTDQAPFGYAHAETNTELITTGLLLGYPIESTVSILQGH